MRLPPPLSLTSASSKLLLQLLLRFFIVLMMLLGCVSAFWARTTASSSARATAAFVVGGGGGGRCSPPPPSQLRFTGSTAARRLLSTSLQNDDHQYLEEAAQCAERGLGHTFPNPAVGCVLVRRRQAQPSSTETTAVEVVLGRGFHPRAGFPHAEVFALWEAAGHVESGMAAAQAVVDAHNNNNKSAKEIDDATVQLLSKVQQLADQYSSEGGPAALFNDCLVDPTGTTTAYVTLEPCCHYGQTPPCATALTLARVDRVVVGLRDPNPRVDGGGVAVLEQAGIPVVVVGDALQQRCAALVTNFVNRIAPHSNMNWQEALIGKHRRALRAHANRLQSRGQLETVQWGGKNSASSSVTVDDNMMAAIVALPLPPEWMEHVDQVLWKSELVMLKLNKAVAKRKGVQWLGERIAEQLQAHVAQTKVRTCGSG